jgi:hypothetical protein
MRFYFGHCREKLRVAKTVWEHRQKLAVEPLRRAVKFAVTGIDAKLLAIAHASRKKSGAAAELTPLTPFLCQFLRLLTFAAVLCGEGLDDAEASLIDAVSQLVNLAGEEVIGNDG